MAYEKQTFVDNETILCAEHLNHIEEGIAAAYEQAATPGKDGEDGADGATFTPSVSASGDLSWSNNKGLANPSIVNIRGPEGPAGSDGKTPVKGTDYFTDAEIQSIVDQVVAQVGTGGGGVAVDLPNAMEVSF